MISRHKPSHNAHVLKLEALGTIWHVYLYDSITPKAWSGLKSELSRMIFNFEELYSRFNTNSLVGRLNQAKILGSFPIELVEMIIYGQQIKQLTRGYFDIFIGHLMENIGYDEKYDQNLRKTREFKPENSTLFIKKPDDLVLSQYLDENLLNLTCNEIRISNEVKLDLGGLGKGWLVDKLSKFLIEKGHKFYTINGGGDIFTTGLGLEKEKIWLENPFNFEEVIGSVELANSAVACSSSNRRKFGQNHHLINPLDQSRVIDQIAAVFTYASSTLQADVASTCLFICPETQYVEIAATLQTEYLIVYSDGSYRKSDNYPGELIS